LQENLHAIIPNLQNSALTQNSKILGRLMLPILVWKVSILSCLLTLLNWNTKASTPAYTRLEGVNFIMFIDITELEYKRQHTLLNLIFIDLY
jgi:hypothetical protein